MLEPHVSLLAMPHFDPGRNRIEMTVRPGTSIAEMVDLALPALLPSQRGYLVVYIGEHLILPGVWSQVRPKPGTLVVLRVLPGRSALRGLLSILISVAVMAAGQFYLAPFLSGTLGLGATAVRLGVSAFNILGNIAGSLLINALIPLKPPDKGRKESPTYSIDGWRNVPNPDGPIPCVLGFHRMAPVYAASPYTEVVGDDNYIRALFCFGYGPINLSNFRIGDTKLHEFEGGEPFEDPDPANWTAATGPLEIEVREGWPGDAPISLYPRQVVQEGVGTHLSNEPPIEDAEPEAKPVKRFAARDSTEAEVDLLFPGGLFQTNDEGEMRPGRATVLIEQRPVTEEDWEEVVTLQFEEEERDTFSRSHRWVFPVRGHYEIRLTRTDPEHLQVEHSERVDWSALKSFRPEYPIKSSLPLALVAVRIKATKQLNGTLDTFNCDASRICLDWDSATQTWIERETRNPASLYRFVLQSVAMAYPLADDEIDIEGLQDWHEFCVLKNLTYDFIHDSETSVWETLAQIAATGRATPHDKGDRWGVMIDRPRDKVVAHISPRNSWGFEGERPYAKFPDAFRVKFSDQTNEYNVSERIVPWPVTVALDYLSDSDGELLMDSDGVLFTDGAGEQLSDSDGQLLTDSDGEQLTDFATALESESDDPEVTESIELPGVTDPATIWRETRWRQYQLIHRLDRYMASQDFESTVLTRGDRAALSHDVLDRTMAAARVTDVDGDTIELDELITLVAGQSYACRFRHIKEVGETEADEPALSLLRTVQGGDGETSTLVLTGTGDAPSVGDLALFGPSSRESFDCIVQSIERGENLTARLTLMDHAPIIDALTDDEVPPPWDGRVGEIVWTDDGAPAVPVIVSVRSSTQTIDDDVIVSLKPGIGGAFVSTYEVQHRLTGAGSWSASIVVQAAAAVTEIGGYGLGDSIEIRARAIGLTGLQSDFSATTTHVYGSGDPAIAGIDSFSAVRQPNDMWRFTWEIEDLSGDPDAATIAGVRIRYRLGAWGAWGDLNALHTGLLTASPWDMSTPEADDTYTFGIVTVTSQGDEGDPMLIYTPPYGHELLTDSDAAILTDSDAEYLMEAT